MVVLPHCRRLSPSLVLVVCPCRSSSSLVIIARPCHWFLSLILFGCPRRLSSSLVVVAHWLSLAGLSSLTTLLVLVDLPVARPCCLSSSSLLVLIALPRCCSFSLSSSFVVCPRRSCRCSSSCFSNFGRSLMVQLHAAGLPIFLQLTMDHGAICPL